MEVRCLLRRQMLVVVMTMAVVICPQSGCSKSNSPTTKPSGVHAARYIGLDLPEDARNVQYFEQRFFTLVCLFSLEVDTAEVEPFLARNEVLPARSEFGTTQTLARRLATVIKAADWSDLPVSPGVCYARREGRRNLRGKGWSWTSIVALAPVADHRTQVYILYIEEAASSAGPASSGPSPS